MGRWVYKNEALVGESSLKAKSRPAFTLIELMVTISIISLLLAILSPAINAARKSALRVVKLANQRSIGTSVNVFANDYHGRYPFSVATVGTSGGSWNWADPRLITGYPNSYEPRMSNGGHRSLSGYLQNYVENPEILHCNSSPDKLTYWQQAWQEGDNWDHPGTPQVLDPVSGTFSFFWNYTGYLPDTDKVFRGPRGTAGGTGQSTVLLSDYFGANTWRNKDQYGSCESFDKAGSTSSSYYYSNFWAGGDDQDELPKVKLSAVYTDGHAAPYDQDEVVKMKVANSPDGLSAFPDKIGKGTFFIPANSLK